MRSVSYNIENRHRAAAREAAVQHLPTLVRIADEAVSVDVGTDEAMVTLGGAVAVRLVTRCTMHWPGSAWGISKYRTRWREGGKRSTAADRGVTMEAWGAPRHIRPCFEWAKCHLDKRNCTGAPFRQATESAHPSRDTDRTLASEEPQ
jgi:hypothetical protein